MGDEPDERQADRRQRLHPRPGVEGEHAVIADAGGDVEAGEETWFLFFDIVSALFLDWIGWSVGNFRLTRSSSLPRDSFGSGHCHGDGVWERSGVSEGT